MIKRYIISSLQYYIGAFLFLGVILGLLRLLDMTQGSGEVSLQEQCEAGDGSKCMELATELLNSGAAEGDVQEYQRLVGLGCEAGLASACAELDRLNEAESGAGAGQDKAK